MVKAVGTIVDDDLPVLNIADVSVQEGVLLFLQWTLSEPSP